MSTIKSAGPSAKHWRLVVLPLALVILCLAALVILLAIIGRQMREDRLIVAIVLAAICLGVLFRVGLRLHSLTVESTQLTRVARQHEQDLERAGREKEVFVRGITHDLKNPIGAIDAYAELLEMGVRGDLAADQKEMVKRIRRCAQQTLRIISDLLDLATGDGGALPVHSQEIDVNRLISDVVEDYRAKLESSGFAVKLKPSPVQPHVLTDAARLREILGNLLMNAAKHTPPGGEVVVAVEAPRKGADRVNAVAVKVSDTGPGIPDELKDKIFEEFMRGDQSEGSGIGLSISRRMARALGGDLVVSGASRSGATFALIVPNAPAQPQRQVQS